MSDDGPSMDQEVAKQLLTEGATLIFINLPTESEFGIDLKSWHTGNKFKGVKMIPSGLHMFFYNITNKYGDIAPRVSFIHNFKKSEIVVKKWDPDLEEMTDDSNEEEISRIKTNLYNIDPFLGPYPYDIWEQWKCLISNISEKLVKRVTPECGIIRSALDLVTGENKPDEPVPSSSGSHMKSELVSKGIPSSTKDSDSNVVESSETVRSSENQADQLTSNINSSYEIRRRRRRDPEASLLPHLEPAPGTQLRFTTVPDDLFPKGSTPSDITRHSIDPTFTLKTLLSSMENEQEYIGEVELSFACFLVGLSLDALEAWKALVTLACRCENAVSQRPRFYAALLSTLNSQLQHIPEDFLVDIVESENAIYTSLRCVFRTTLTENKVDPRLKKTARVLSEKLSERFGWDFTNLDEDDEDEAPVIVDLQDHV